MTDLLALRAARDAAAEAAKNGDFAARIARDNAARAYELALHQQAEAMLEALDEAVGTFGRPNSPWWTVPSNFRGWLTRARAAIGGNDEGR